ncbi:hypothetical protein BS17DRAFT_798838 [Gyrodon lividus]|nr:hypothetical protein BS17DRAFT_798838 [Gyrodon lividus]
MALLTGKIVRGKGSSRGIGRACALEDQESEVELLSLKQEIETTDSHCKVVDVPGDIADSKTAQKIVTADVLASNAGKCPLAEFFLPRERIRQVNLDGSFYVSCAVALGKYNIRCDAILHGTIDTNTNEENLAHPEKREYTIKRTALARLGRPVVFLASGLAKYVTGAPS